ncbi:MAG: hypothetical protein K2M68_06010 [Muribaculaceae bacterium]|nr:hypothetical protein [Muribaculaceae bacterium]
MKHSLIAAISLLSAATVWAGNHSFTQGKYTISYDDATLEMSVFVNGTELFKNAKAEAVYNLLGSDTDATISTATHKAAVYETDVKDCFGSGKSIIFSYTDGTATMKQYFNFYGDTDYFICYNTVEANDGVTVLQTRRMIPLSANESSYTTPLGGSATKRMLWVPFDNDGHGRYHNYSFSSMKESESISHEVGAVFDAETRQGLVAGSVDHDKWKSGIQMYGRYNTRLYKFELLSGLTNTTTRDVLPHGKVKGVSVSSARYMVGLFDDWREGFNTFGDCCNMVVKRPEWAAGNPVGWSTYGVQQERTNETGVKESVAFLRDNFYGQAGFYDADGIISVSFDACANDNIADSRINSLIKNTFSRNNEILGMYGGHLCLWPWGVDSPINGTGPGSDYPSYIGKNMALKVNGDVYPMPCNGALAVDPTHPAVRANLEQFMNKWGRWGVKYVKMDFLNCGIIEGDSWYDPEITTGVMAYNYAMQMMYEICEKYDMYIVMAMSPLFPYQYAHGRRTCCDRFSKIDETEYVMNAISYGWWTDRLYTVNDPDQLVLVGRNNKKSETIGENRARATSGMVTGAYIWGDNFSEKCVHTSSEEASKQGVSVGDPVGWPAESRERAKQILSNKDINEYVRTHTGSFMPVDGGDPTSILNGSGQQSERLFYRMDDNYCYVAAFCFSRYNSYSTDLKWERLGINGGEVTAITELWSGDNVDFSTDGFKVSVPTADAKVYRIEFSWSAPAGVDDVFADTTDNDNLIVGSTGGVINVTANRPIASVTAYGIDGKTIAACAGADSESVTLDTHGFSGVAIVSVSFTSGDSKVERIIVK